MNAAASKHPPREFLQAFGLGKLNDAAATKVSMHLETCADCQRQVAELSCDSLLEQLRKAHGAMSTPVPSETPAPAASAQKPEPAIPTPAGVPAELLNNSQYEIIRELGAGGMGVVYLAKNKFMDRLEVLKVISTAMVHKSGALDRFLREIRSAAALSHDNVVKAHSALQFGDLLVFAMEYVEGEDLAKVVKTQGPLPIANACFYARQVALGLQHAHEKNMVHRDIKPHNLILARAGKKHIVKILDFGLAKASSEKKMDYGLTGEGKMLGTPDYMAPEQIQDAATADIRADIYSLGCTLYYFLTGATPFNANSLYGLLQAHQTQEAKSVNLVRPEVPVALGAIVAKMMAKDPAKRYQKPTDVAQALAPYFAKGGAKGQSPALALSVGESVKAEPARRSPTPKPAEAIAPLPLATPVRQVTMVGANPFSLPSDTDEPKTAPKGPTGRMPRWVKPKQLAAVVVGAVFLGLLLWAAGIIIRVESKDGTLIIKSDDPNAVVKVTPEGGATLTYGKERREVKLKPGKYGIELADAKSGLKLSTTQITLSAGDKKTIEISWENKGDTPGKIADALPPKKLDLPKTVAVHLGGGVKMEFVLIPKGKFNMGSPTDERDRNPFQRAFDEAQHEVEITKSFYLAKYAVTQEQYAAITGGDPSFFSATGARKGQVAGLDTKQFPVENVSWNDAQACCVDLTKKDKQGRRFRLPTEAEWEFACRAGTQTAFFFGDDHRRLGDYVWFKVNSNGRPHPAGEKKPNAWGLYDMNGNVWQWCEDYYGPYEGLNAKDPLRSVKHSKEHRVVRGGSWPYTAEALRAATRSSNPPNDQTPDIGFRIALDLPEEAAPVPSADGFVPLFNGKDLTGWEGNAELWSVRDGAIVGSTFPNGFRTQNNTFLCSKEKYKDFELKFQVRLKDGKGNSGVQIRSKVLDPDQHIVAGPQADIGDGYWGGVYGEKFGNGFLKQAPADKVKKAVKNDDFNDYYIKCVGKHVTIAINGVTMVDDDLISMPDEGIIAWQIHAGGPMDVTFRKIQFKNLSAAPAPGDSTADPDHRAAAYVLSNGGTVRLIDQTSGKESHIGAVADLPREPFRLTWIGLRGKQVTDVGLASFKDCDCKNLTGLDLSGTRVSDVGLAYFKNCKNLTELWLNDTKVGDAGLASFKDSQNLTILWVQRTQVTDAGLAYFKECKNLTLLDLSKTQVSDAGLAYFKGCKNLTCLNLGADIQVSDAGVAYFRDCKNLTQLWVHGTQVTGTCLVHFKDCKNLTFLNLCNTQVTVELGALKHWTNLREIHLHGTNVGDTGLVHLKDCKNLTALVLTGTKVTSAGVADLKKALPKCRIDVSPEIARELPPENLDPDRKAAEYVLSIGGTVRVNDEVDDTRAVDELPKTPFRLTCVDLHGNPKVRNAGLAAFDGCKNITVLRLNETQVKDVGLAYFKDCKNLTTLHLDRAEVTDAGLGCFKDCTNLKELHLSVTKVTGRGLTHFKDCKNLTSLALRNTQVGDTGLVNFQECKNLTFLMLDGTQVSDAGLDNFKDCKNLVELHLEETQVTDKGMVYFKERKNLVVLCLAHTKVSDVGLVYFKDCKKLTRLRLHGTQMSDKGLAYFKGCENLMDFEHRGSKVTKAGVDDFRKAFPKCRMDGPPK